MKPWYCLVTKVFDWQFGSGAPLVLQNLQREMQAQLTTEESETLKRLIRDSKKNSDDMLERIK